MKPKILLMLNSGQRVYSFETAHITFADTHWTYLWILKNPPDNCLYHTEQLNHWDRAAATHDSGSSFVLKVGLLCRSSASRPKLVWQAGAQHRLLSAGQQVWSESKWSALQPVLTTSAALLLLPLYGARGAEAAAAAAVHSTCVTSVSCSARAHARTRYPAFADTVHFFSALL